jgi:23S rRNA pseudouridine1911/1915/1917 synthase
MSSPSGTAPIEILHHDRHLVIVCKPPGIDVHGQAPDAPGTLVSLVAAQLGLRPQQLHPAARLDRPASGVVPMARSKLGRQALTQQYQHREISRTYLAIARGVPAPPSGRWDRAIGTDRRDSRSRTLDGADARPALTDYDVRRAFRDAWSFVELRPATGRTHQLRVHLAQVARCPIVGDRRYGGPPSITLADGAVVAVPRLMLHAGRISLRHPESGAQLVVEAGLWPDVRALLERLEASG